MEEVQGFRVGWPPIKGKEATAAEKKNPRREREGRGETENSKGKRKEPRENLGMGGSRKETYGLRSEREREKIEGCAKG